MNPKQDEYKELTLKHIMVKVQNIKDKGNLISRQRKKR
jgi:hypothetical protein